MVSTIDRNKFPSNIIQFLAISVLKPFQNFTENSFVNGVNILWSVGTYPIFVSSNMRSPDDWHVPRFIGAIFDI